MLMLDFSETGDNSIDDVDVCIVGSGPAGLTIARELSGHGIRTVILESGGLVADRWADSLNEIESVAAPRVMDQTKVRNRVFGGTSSTWSGRLALLDESDFSARNWVPNSGWPIARQALDDYFGRTKPYLGCNLGDNTKVEVIWKSLGPFANRPAFDPHLLQDYFWSYSVNDDKTFGMRFALSSQSSETDATCFLNATVTQIETNSSGRAVSGVEAVGRDGIRRTIKAGSVVLCAGGIENARLLLASNRTMSCGVGNQNNQVGRYLMDHPRGPIGYVDLKDYARQCWWFANYKPKLAGRRATLVYGVALTPALCRAEGLLNCAAYFDGKPDAGDPWRAMSRLVRARGRSLASLRDVARGTGFLLGGLVQTARGRDVPRRVETLSLQCIVEQAPDADSRVTLSSRVDALGMPLSRIAWRKSPQETRSIRRLAQLFVAETRRLGLPSPKLIAPVLDPDADVDFPDVAHPTGTTRMSADPRRGVVDENCRVHGVEGLYVAGSSVFPTSGHANPTHLIVALAIRLADHLKERTHRPSMPDDVASAQAQQLSVQPQVFVQ